MENFKKTFDKLLIDTLGISQEDIKFDVHFTNDLGADSLDLVELTIEFEKVFKITIPDKDVEQLQTIGDVESYLKKQVELCLKY
ncbi:MAG: acyl carrier protein [Flavobacteriales bacterium]|jgi:acyl carrier protein|nr:acyl carrier protein [Flavobacteriales bacterium]